jgi:4-diphosphocytidyl-2-C-methyl-D-erythritol kinase
MLLRAFAKINLDLRILGRRPDGFHEVRTLLQTIDWADEISIEPADRFEFTAHGVEGGDTNLVVRAVRQYEALTAKTAQVRIELFKHIPAGAGLGGGSADAAVTLMALERFCGQDLAPAGREHALRSLGSDVPFFAWGGKAVGVGRGDQILPIEDADSDFSFALIVITSDIVVSTAEAYSWLTVSDKSNSIVGFCADSFSGRQPAEQGNDFESAVFAHHPRLKDLKNELLRVGARRAALSGSGSAVFGIFDTEQAAATALPGLSGLGDARVVRPLSRAEYLRSVWGVAKR